MKTTHSLDLKVLKLTSAANMIAKQVNGRKAWAGFKGQHEYKKSGLTSAQLAAILNYGSPITGLPSRPFMERAMTGEKRSKINKIIKEHLEKLFREELVNIKPEYATAGSNPRYQKRAVKKMLEELSNVLKQNILDSIERGRYEKLSDSYRHATGRNKFLENPGDFESEITNGTD